MYLTFIFVLVIYMFLHSFLAHHKVKEYLYDRFIKERYYRIFFIAYAILFLIPVAYLYFKANKILFFETNIFLNIIGISLIIFSLYIFYISFKNYDIKEFLGLDRINSGHKIHYQLNTGGINKYVRHPLYSASYPLMTGIFLLSPDNYVLTACIIISIYLPVGIIFEEQKLIAEYGKQYIDYMKNVPMLFPGIKFYKK